MAHRIKNKPEQKNKLNFHKKIRLLLESMAEASFKFFAVIICIAIGITIIGFLMEGLYYILDEAAFEGNPIPAISLGTGIALIILIIMIILHYKDRTGRYK